MKTNNNQNHHTCEFGLESIEYLYDQLGEAQKSKFEAHLHNCLSCSAEFSAFAEVRSSISDWKNLEFSNLTAPVISIPYKEAEKTNINVKVGSSWLDNLRVLFAFSPVWKTAAASALIIVFAGVVYLVFNSSTQNELAGMDNKPIVNTEASPAIEKNLETNDLSSKSSEPSQISQDFSQSEKETSGKVKNVPVKILTDSAKKDSSPVKKVKSLQASETPKKNAVNVKPKSSEMQNLPRLNALPEDDEDDSLRLADLFAEIETK